MPLYLVMIKSNVNQFSDSIKQKKTHKNTCAQKYLCTLLVYITAFFGLRKLLINLY